MKQQPFIIERTFTAPVHRVWKAITNKDQMKQWYFDIADFRAEVGCTFRFAGENEGSTFTHVCEVTEVIPHQKLQYSWRYEGFEGLSFVTFELFAEGAQTRLRLTHEGLETFPANNPNFRSENFAAGWTELIGNLLKKFVEKTSVENPV